MDARDVETALAITPRFYPAALDFGQWPGVLKDLNEVFAARAGNVDLSNLQTREVIATARHGAREEALVRFLAIENHFETPREIADGLGRSYETVRSHLKTLYSKTGARSQADLVGIVQSVVIPGHGCNQKHAQ